MKKKIILLGIISLMLCQRGWADQLEIAPVTIQPGGEATVDITLDNPTAVYTALQFDLTLPEGITLKYDEDEENYSFTKNNTRLKGSKWAINISPVQESSTHFRFIIYHSENGEIQGTSGTLLSITLAATATAAAGIKQGHILNQELTIDTDTSNDTEDVPFGISVTGEDTSVKGMTISIASSGVSLEVTEQTDMGQIPTTVTTADLTYARTLTVGATDEMYTVCLPYTPPTDENLKYYTLSTVSGTTLTFDEVTTPEAYKPYLVVASATSSVGTTAAQSVDLSTGITGTTETGGEYELCGTLYGMTNAEAAAGGNIYILQDAGKWGLVTNTEAGAAADIPPFRAYIVKKSVGGSARLHSVVGNATGINPLSVSSEGESKGVWYTLGGLELTGEPTQKGAYVKDGRVIIK